MHRPNSIAHAGRSARGRALVGLSICILAALQACAVANVDLKGEDRDVLFLGGRVSWEPGQRGLADPLESERAAGGVSTAFELDVSHGSGRDQQTLGPGQMAVFGGATFVGPRQLELEFDLSRVLLDARFSSPRLGGVFAQGFGGLEYSSAEIDVRSSSPTRRSGGGTLTAIGPALGVALVWAPIDLLRFSAEGRLGVGISSDVDELEQLSIDLGLSVFPHESVGLYVGWRQVSYEAEAGEPGESGLDLSLAGPVLGLRIRI